MSDLTISRAIPARSAQGVRGLDRLTAAIRLALRTHATRQTLPEMQDHLLADIGLTRADAVAEAARLPWDTSARRRRRFTGLSGRIKQALETSRRRQIFSRLRRGMSDI